MRECLKRIGIVGSATIDDIVLTNRQYRKMGGVITYAGLTYRRYGLPVLAVSNLARRDFKIESKLAACGIELMSGGSAHTTHFVNHQRGSGRHQLVARKARTIEIEQITPIIGMVDGLHLGPLHPLDIDPRIYSMPNRSNHKVFLDVQGLTRKIVNRQVQLSVSPHLAAGLHTAQIIKASGREHRAMLDFYQLGLSEFMQRFQIEEYVVTLGKDGGFVQTGLGEEINYEASSPEAVDDPTGAGDVFFAAYIANRFYKRRPVHDACRSAAQAAARQVGGHYLKLSQLNPQVL